MKRIIVAFVLCVFSATLVASETVTSCSNYYSEKGLSRHKNASTAFKIESAATLIGAGLVVGGIMLPLLPVVLVAAGSVTTGMLTEMFNISGYRYLDISVVLDYTDRGGALYPFEIRAFNKFKKHVAKVLEGCKVYTEFTDSNNINDSESFSTEVKRTLLELDNKTAFCPEKDGARYVVIPKHVENMVAYKIAGDHGDVDCLEEEELGQE